MTKLNFGRTIAPTSVNRHKLGRMECNGKVVLNGMPTSCQDLWRIGYTLSGIYSIKGPSSNRVETVYCDFDKLPGDEGEIINATAHLVIWSINYNLIILKNSGLQTWIGYTEVKSTPVYFNVGRNTSFNTLAIAMPFEEETLNVGNGMDMSSGIFTAPRSGTYFFTFSSFSENGYALSFNLQLNDVRISTCSYTSYTVTYCNIPYTIKLNVGDRVQVSLQQGSTNNALFTGWLLAEDIFQT